MSNALSAAVSITILVMFVAAVVGFGWRVLRKVDMLLGLPRQVEQIRHELATMNGQLATMDRKVNGSLEWHREHLDRYHPRQLRDGRGRG